MSDHQCRAAKCRRQAVEMQAEIERLRAEAHDNTGLLSLLYDIRVAAGDREGRLMQSELVELIARQREECEQMTAAEAAKRSAPIQRRAPVIGYFARTIPWELHCLAWEAYSQKYGSGQSAEQIADRGGFGAGEMDRFLPDWRERVSAIDAAQPDQRSN